MEKDFSTLIILVTPEGDRRPLCRKRDRHELQVKLYCIIYTLVVFLSTSSNSVCIFFNDKYLCNQDYISKEIFV